jgi:cytochrome b561
MIYICLDDMIIRRAKEKQLARNTKEITNTVLYTTLGVLIGSGFIGMAVVGNCLFLIGVNKVTKIIIKKTGIVNKMREIIKR